MTTRYLWKIVRDAARRAELETAGAAHATPHTLRRTFATELLNNGVRLETVSRLLGHAGTAISESAYAELTDARIRHEVEQALKARHPRQLRYGQPSIVTTPNLVPMGAGGRRLTLSPRSHSTLRPARHL